MTLGCNSADNNANKTESIEKTTNITFPKNDNSKYYTTKDTLIITTETEDTLKYSKSEFNEIIDNHPELLNNKYVQNPDLIYYCSGDRDEFGSEIGQDTYYILYAYFLKQKNGINKYAELRKNLIDIYSNINSLFGHFQYGGTYFGHQYSRILGYAEFSVYLFVENEKSFSKSYDITKEKELYINSLRQIIKDESSIDFETLGKKEKAERNTQLNKIVDNVNKLITNNFYLKRAQAFQYDKYEYY
ncbi:MAG: hypothetical protein ABJB11_11540 [Ferruginibacter sp.]